MQRLLLRTVGPRGARLALPTTCCILLAACAGVKLPVVPLDEPGLAAQTHQQRDRIAVQDALDLPTARALLRAHGPRIAHARADERALQARASINTPWPNPTLEVSPLLFSGTDVLTSSTLGSAWQFGWRVLVFNEPKLADSIDRAAAARARAQRIAVEREEYLALRGELIAVRLAAREVAGAEALEAGAETARTYVQRATDAGAATALDVELANVEVARAEDRAITARDEYERALARIALRLGLPADRITGVSATLLPDMPEALPTADTLRQHIANHHPDLMDLRMQWAEIEATLRLAMARQIPAIDMGLSYDSDDLDTLGLPIGIEIPLFDRNQKEIFTLRGQREALRMRYRATLATHWSEAEAALADVAREKRHLAAMQERLAPAAKRALEIATQAAEAGHADALRVLELSKHHREVQLLLLERELTIWRALIRLERALGAPLLPLPDATASSPHDPEND